jgi:Zn-dependent protease with chaperone function
MPAEANSASTSEAFVPQDDGGIPESIWNNPEFIAASQDLRDAVSIFSNPRFQRILNSSPGQSSEIGFSAEEYAENHQRNPTIFPATFSTEKTAPTSKPDYIPSWKNTPDDLKPEIPDSVETYQRLPSGSVFRDTLETHGGKLPITNETIVMITSAARDFGAKSVKILTAATAETDAEKSLLTEMQKAAAKIGLPEKDGAQVILPLFVMQDMDMEKVRPNAIFFGGLPAVVFTEHYVKDPSRAIPAIQEGIALHELGHGLQTSGNFFVAMHGCARLLGETGTAAMGGAILSSAIMVAGAYNFEDRPFMNDLVNQPAAIIQRVQESGIEAHQFQKDLYIGLMGSAAVMAAGATLAAATFIKQKNEFAADAKSIELGDSPEQIIEHAKTMPWKKTEDTIDRSLDLAHAARQIVSGMLGMEDTFSTHPSTDARVANMQQVYAARQQRESGGASR